ncbi:MAG: hypothetical protein OXF20_14215 [Gammaproteobacteria bacterium]|nr:hypothetical protein [Gammaproteobacteria bacterium]
MDNLGLGLWNAMPQVGLLLPDQDNGLVIDPRFSFIPGACRPSFLDGFDFEHRHIIMIGTIEVVLPIPPYSRSPS